MCIARHSIDMRRSGYKLLGFLFAVALVAFSYGDSYASGKKILFINPGFADQGFWHQVSATMQAAAEEFNYELIIVSANRDWRKMLSLGEAAINKENPDFLILVNENQKAPFLMDLANSKDIPTLLLLNTLTFEQQQTYGKPREKFKSWIGSITPDNEIAGFEMVWSLREAARNHPVSEDGAIELISLVGDRDTPASIDRVHGLDRGLRLFSDITEKSRKVVNWSEDIAYGVTKEWLSDHPLEAVWAANDPIANGAIRAIREKDLEPGEDILVTGLNWSIEAVRMVNSGEMTMTHGGHFLAGAWSIVLIHDFDQGRDFAAFDVNIMFPMSAIHKGNAAKYLGYFENRNWSQIPFKEFGLWDKQGDKKYDFTLDHILRLMNG